MQDLSGEGRLSGVGGAWVEFDGNLPNGESMIRQLLYGHQEFYNLFGKLVFCEFFVIKLGKKIDD